MGEELAGTLFGSDTQPLVLDPGGGTLNGKSLLRRATGRFYTPEEVGRPLARRMAEHLAGRPDSRAPITATDPFCGDGRLIEWLLEETAQSIGGSWSITLWDNDEDALRTATERITAVARRVGVKAEVQAEAGDSFELAPAEFSTYDAVITNPPWELLKPDRRELEHLDAAQKEDYVASIRALDRRLAELYPTAQPVRRFAGWGTNLARVGTEVALRLIVPGGTCGVVSPSSLFADSNSEPLRAWLFENMTLLDISYFPAEARLFEFVDQPFVSFVAANEPGASSLHVGLTRYGADRGVEERANLELSRSGLASSGYVVPVSFGALGVKLLQGLSHLPTFAELEEELNIWAGRELDETNRSRYMVSKSPHPFLKARKVRRFSQDHLTDEYVDPSVVPIPASTRHPRLAWRDVSRPTQKRRVQATLIEQGWVTGNSLHVAYSRRDDLVALAWLLGIMSSIPFEYQLRSTLSTGHVSLGAVRRVRLPIPHSAVEQIATLARRRFADATCEPELEGVVAKAYGLDRDAVAAMTEAFPKVTDQEAADILGACR